MYSAVRNYGLATLRDVLRQHQEQLERLFLQLLSRNEVLTAACRMRWQEFWAFLNDYKLAPTLVTRLEADRIFKLALQEHVSRRDAHLLFEDFLYALILLADHGFQDNSATAVRRAASARQEEEQEYKFRLLLFWIDGSGEFFPGNVECIDRYHTTGPGYGVHEVRFAYSRLPKRAIHALRLCFEKFSRWGQRSNVGPTARMHMWQFHSFVQHTSLKALLPSPVHADITFIKVAGKSRSVKFAQFLEIIERVFGVFSVLAMFEVRSGPQGGQRPSSHQPVKPNADTAGAMVWLKVLLDHACPFLQESGELSAADVAAIRDQLERYLQVFTRPEQTCVEEDIEQPDGEVSLTDTTVQFEVSSSSPNRKLKSTPRSKAGRVQTPQSCEWSTGVSERKPGKKAPRRHGSAFGLGTDSFTLGSTSDFPVPSASAKLEAARDLLERVRMRKASDASMAAAAAAATPESATAASGEVKSNKQTLSELFASLLLPDPAVATTSSAEKAQKPHRPGDNLSLSSVEDVASDISGVSTDDSQRQPPPPPLPGASTLVNGVNGAGGGGAAAAVRVGVGEVDGDLEATIAQLGDTPAARGDATQTRPGGTEETEEKGGRSSGQTWDQSRDGAIDMSNDPFSVAVDPLSALKPHAYSLYAAAHERQDAPTETDTEAIAAKHGRWCASKRLGYGPTMWERLLVHRNQQTLVMDPTQFLRPQSTLLDAAASLLRSERQQHQHHQQLRRVKSAPVQSTQDPTLYQLTSNAFRSIEPPPEAPERGHPEDGSKASSPVSAGHSVNSRGRTLSYDDAICDIPRQMGELRNKQTAQIQCYFSEDKLEASPTFEQLTKLPAQELEATVRPSRCNCSAKKGSLTHAMLHKTPDGAATDV